MEMLVNTYHPFDDDLCELLKGVRPSTVPEATNLLAEEYRLLRPRQVPGRRGNVRA